MFGDEFLRDRASYSHYQDWDEVEPPYRKRETVTLWWEEWELVEQGLELLLKNSESSDECSVICKLQANIIQQRMRRFEKVYVTEEDDDVPF